MINFLTNLRVLKSFNLIRRIPNSLFLIILILIAGIAEAIGISSLVPVASSLTSDFSGSTELSFPFYYFRDFLSFFGLSYSFNNLLIVTFCCMSFAFLVIFLQEVLIVKARYKFCEDIRNEASNAIYLSKWEHLSDISSGEIANKIIHESERGTEAIMALLLSIAGIFQISIYILFCLLLSWKLTIVAILTILIAVIFSKYLIIKVGLLGKLAVDANNLYSKNMVDFSRGSKLIKATNLNSGVVNKLSKINKNSISILIKIAFNQSLMKLQIQIIIGLSLVLILYCAISIFSIDVSILLVFLYIMIRLAPKFSSVQGLIFSYFSNIPSIEVLDKVIYDASINREEEFDYTKMFNGIEAGFKLSEVSYKYPGNDFNTLKKISLSIEANKFYAIVGKTGCGKSTLLNLIMSLIVPSSGTINIDGVNINDFKIESYRNLIGFVPQEPTFFDGTIRENLCFGVVSDEKHIWDCLESAQIKKFIETLEFGLETLIGESGGKLSGGQKQRLAIARALIRSPSVLVLDEATSAMDSESEQNFQKTLEKIAKNYTLVVVAHRLSTIKKADNIFVLDEGVLVEEGSFKTLNSRPGVFSKLVAVQFNLD